MSLTSAELNYLVWRYLQESGLELAAYALEQSSHCLSYESKNKSEHVGNNEINEDKKKNSNNVNNNNNENTNSANPSNTSKPGNSELLKRIQPGCLVDLVQKGILYSIAEYRASDNSDVPDMKLAEVVSLFGALIENKKHAKEDIEIDVKQDGELYSKKRHRLPTEEEEEGEVNDTLGKKAKSTISANNSGDENEIGISSDKDTANNNKNEENSPENGKVNAVEPIEDETHHFDYVTTKIKPDITLPPSITSYWHPQTEVLAYGKEDSSAVIVAIQDHLIAESVTLLHPKIATALGDATISGTGESNDASTTSHTNQESPLISSEISIVSWAPQGNIIVTSSISGELRAWLPDGKLKNIANTATFQSTELTNKGSAMVSNLIWSESGQFLLSIDINNQICLWNGNNLNIIQQIRPPEDEQAIINNPSSNNLLLDACWLDEYKFALSTLKNNIRIFAISNTGFGNSIAKPIGLLPGHDHPISILKFNKLSKILASCSDVDYIIKIWHSNSLQLNIELNKAENGKEHDIAKENLIQYHKAPIINLSWLDNQLLLSISMDGVINIWNVKTGDAVVSTNIVKTFNESIKQEITANASANENENESEVETEPKQDQNEDIDFIIFSASVSSNKKWLVVGDDNGKVSIWDIALENYRKKRYPPINILHCLGTYEAPKQNIDNSEFGICDISWSSISNKVCVSYKGGDSIVVDWKS